MLTIAYNYWHDGSSRSDKTVRTNIFTNNLYVAYICNYQYVFFKFARPPKILEGLKTNIKIKSRKNNCANTEFIILVNVISDTNEIAKYFNNYFVNIGKSLSGKIHSNVDPLTYLIPNEHNLVLPIIQDKKVRNIIMALKNTASGYDCIVGSIMKQCVDNYITPLTHIINLSIAQGYFPDE